MMNFGRSDELFKIIYMTYWSTKYRDLTASLHSRSSISGHGMPANILEMFSAVLQKQIHGNEFQKEVIMDILSIVLS